MMSEPMHEFTEEIDLRPLADKYPSARKVTVDMSNRTAYVFTGSGNRATTISGVEFDALVKLLPAAEESQADEAQAGEPHEVEPVEAVISVVKEPEAKTRPARGKEKS